MIWFMKIIYMKIFDKYISVNILKIYKALNMKYTTKLRITGSNKIKWIDTLIMQLLVINILSICKLYMRVMHEYID